MRTRLLLIAGFTFLALVVLSISMGGAYAQSGPTPKTATPLPSPTNNGGKATWTIKSQSFQSNYPKGFEFDLDASSSGGKITLATVRWKHTPANSRQSIGKIDASGKITASWVPTVSGAIPQWVGVDYWWSLTDEAGNIFETPHSYEEYSDTTRKWTRAESDDVIVFTQEGVPANVAPTIIQAVKSHRAAYFELWGKLLNYRPRAIIYSNDDAWTEWNPGINTTSGGVRVVGQTSDAWGGTVQLYLPRLTKAAEDLAYGTILHEFGHLYQFYNGISPQSVCWFREGDAEYNATFERDVMLQRVKDMAASGDLPSLQGEGPSCTGSQARDAYDIGYAYFKWLGDTYGPQVHLKLWSQVGRGVPYQEALESVTGMSFVDSETAFRKWLGMENPVAPTPVEFASMDFPPTPDYSKPTATP